jgi:hypothetical protein
MRAGRHRGKLGREQKHFGIYVWVVASTRDAPTCSAVRPRSSCATAAIKWMAQQSPSQSAAIPAPNGRRTLGPARSCRHGSGMTSPSSPRQQYLEECASAYPARPPSRRSRRGARPLHVLQWQGLGLGESCSPEWRAWPERRHKRRGARGTCASPAAARLPEPLCERSCGSAWGGEYEIFGRSCADGHRTSALQDLRTHSLIAMLEETWSVPSHRKRVTPLAGHALREVSAAHGVS